MKNELHPVMYRLFLCILLHEVKKANVYVKRKFFDARLSCRRDGRSGHQILSISHFSSSAYSDS